MKARLSHLSAALLLGVFATGANAALLCSSSGYSGPLDVSDMTFDSKSADDCYGIVEDNDNGSNVWHDGDWYLFAKDDTPGGEISSTILGINFTLDAVPEVGAKSGTWTLSWTQTGSPGYDLTMDVVGVIKASDRFASYLFEDLLFTADGSGSGTWKVSFLNKGGNIPDLSHLSLYYKNASHSSTSSSSSSSTSSSSTSSSSTSGGGEVPEPGVLGLLGLGLLGLALARRRG